MKKNKFFTAAITLLLIAFFTTSWVTAALAEKPTGISITVPFYYSSGAPPNVTFTGEFTISGAFTASGIATMDAAIKGNNNVYHCIWTLPCAGGTIIIHEQCVLAGSSWKGRWEIVSGTGDYTNLRGNGSALMPGCRWGICILGTINRFHFLKGRYFRITTFSLLRIIHQTPLGDLWIN